MSNEKDTSFDQLVNAIRHEIQASEASRYSSRVLREFRNPRNLGRLKESHTRGILTGSCGDTIEIYLEIHENTIHRATFMTDGCGVTIACGSMLTQLIEGMGIQEARMISDTVLLEALDGLPPENVHCAQLAVATLQKALDGFDHPTSNGNVDTPSSRPSPPSGSSGR